MDTRDFGLVASWRALTAARGWWKPVALLTLVGWIPLIGQIAVLRYALEWGRLAAWGSDEAPRRDGVDVGKVLVCGIRALIVRTPLVVAGGAALWFATGGRHAVFSPLEAGFYGSWAQAATAYRIDALGGVAWVLGLAIGTFVIAAMLRATLYDALTAGWRLDRLAQMVARDASGFLRAALSVVLGAVAVAALSLLAAAALDLPLQAGLAGLAAHHGRWHFMFDGGAFLHRLFSLEPASMLVAVLGAAAIQLACGAVAVALQLACVHTVACWFRRFDVSRWGVSSDPLPPGAPSVPGAPSAPGR